MGVPEVLEGVPLMRMSSKAMILGVSALMGLTSCSGTDVSVVKVDDHVFHVPKNHLVEGTIPWLPSSQSAGLKFLVNPGVRPEEQMIVTMESSATTCHPKTPPASSQLFTACSSAKRAEEGSPAGGKYAVEKVHKDGDPTQWEYRLKVADGNLGSVVASCYSLSEKQGLCTALSNYGDLVYSLGLRDEDISRLPTLHKNIRDLLRAWERAGNL